MVLANDNGQDIDLILKHQRNVFKLNSVLGHVTDLGQVFGVLCVGDYLTIKCPHLLTAFRG